MCYDQKPQARRPVGRPAEAIRESRSYAPFAQVGQQAIGIPPLRAIHFAESGYDHTKLLRCESWANRLWLGVLQSKGCGSRRCNLVHLGRLFLLVGCSICLSNESKSDLLNNR